MTPCVRHRRPTELSPFAIVRFCKMQLVKIIGRLGSLAAGFAACASAQLLLPTLLPDATQGSYYYQTLTPSVGSDPYHSLLTDGSTLPDGLQFSDTQYGPQISGTPSVFGQFSFTIEVSDASTPPIRQARQYHLTIHQSGSPPFVFVATTLPDATYGAPYGPQILVTGGTYPYTPSYAGGGFGFSFDGNASLISVGQVSASPGTYQILVTMTDSSFPNLRISQTLTITVKPGISLAPVLLTGTVFQPYSNKIFVTGGGTAPYHFSVASGALPPGVSLDGATGALSGTPAIPGTYSFQIGVTDSTGLTGSQDYVLEIYGLVLSMTPGGPLPTGRMGVAYPATTFGVQGGVAPYTLTRVGGVVPPGMTFGSDRVLSGTPTKGGSYTLDFRATDQIGDTGAFLPTLLIQDIAPAELPDAYAGAWYHVPFDPVGYSNACILSLVSGTLPNGMAFVSVPPPSQYELGGFYLTGTPAQAGAYTFTVEAQDPGGLPVDRTYTLRVSLPRLRATKTHMGQFSPGQIGATYIISTGNSGGGATTGSVTVSEVVPAGLTLTSMSGDGWNCSIASCTRSDVLNAYAGYPPITVTVNVASNAASPVVNAVNVSGGGSPSDSSSDSTNIAAPLLSISKYHAGDFTQRQINATYMVTVSNSGAAGPTSGTVTVTETVPSGLALVSMAGAGWTCPAGGATCTRNDALPSGTSYPAITVTVNVGASAASPQVNSVSVSGGGSATANASDSTVIIPLPANLTVAKTHSGNFTQGQTGGTYTVTVSNGASAFPTSGMVTVTETVPSGMTLVSMSGTGWTCPGTAANNCTTASVLNGGASYAPITVTVNVASDASSQLTNQVSVSGGGSGPASIGDLTLVEGQALRFVPVTPCRIADTRDPDGPFGGPILGL